jgi:hypothetical protein
MSDARVLANGGSRVLDGRDRERLVANDAFRLFGICRDERPRRPGSVRGAGGLLQPGSSDSTPQLNGIRS